MKQLSKLIAGVVILLTTLSVFASQPKGQFIQPNNLYPKVKITTNIGTIILELDRSKAPLTVDNFLSYVHAKRYDKTLFHRLEHDFVLQGGGYTHDFKSITEFPAIVNESGNGLKNDQGTIAMARLYQPHSATSQFFINLADNDSLNPGRNWGYTVFGYITEGEELLEKLEKIETDLSPELGWLNFPVEKIEIISAEILSE